MPHIREEELHAYLDQALARLRCVEIESHLAECTPCRTARDDIAALRDRTTAMLARLAPRRTIPPPLADLRRRAAQRASRREQLRQRAAWAASVVVALGVGWGASYLVHPPATRTLATRSPAPQAAAAPVLNLQPDTMTVAPAPAETPAIEVSAPETEKPQVAPPVKRAVARRYSPAVPAGRTPSSAHLANVGGIAKDGQLELGGVWRNLSWDGAKEQAGNTPARIDGLPVTEVQTQAGDSGRRPLMVVAQQLASGEVIRTIEGPVSDVSALLGTRPGEEYEPATPAGRSGLGSALAFRHGDRMFAVTGSLPSDSLRAMMRRLNLMMRVR
jgi:hypothetical protein